ncbi:MAG TPA: hypothetical protein VIQ30_24365 [Pseudonocardia sp.]
MTRHRAGARARASELCFQCMGSRPWCRCPSGRHRLTIRRPTSHVLHPDRICVPAAPPVGAVTALVASLFVGLVWVAGTVPAADRVVVPVSCEVGR